MGRWLVILSLALGQCPDIAVASPQSLDIPLPKPRPSRRDHQPAPAAVVKEDVTQPSSSSPRPVAQAGAGDTSEPPPVRRRAGQSGAAPEFAPPFPRETAPRPSEALVQFGKANGDCSGGKRIISAYYWEGQRTASGQRFDPHGMTAAHRTLPFGTRLTVSNPRTGRSVIVVVNDRGPFVSGVGLDLSLGAAQAIGMRGTGAVCISPGATASEGNG